MQGIAETRWEAVVIGTGIGGGTVGRALAEGGMRVLFVEKGRAGYRTEETRIDILTADPVARAIRGLWPDPVIATIDGVTQEVFAPLGAGLGGSSVFYAATLERPSRHDLDDLPGRPHPTGGWPLSYDSLAPWLAAAEALYRVAGDPDPLDPGGGGALAAPPPLGAADAALMAGLRARGLHPYRLHAALAGLPGCTACLGRKCPRPCKMDGRSAGVEPALATGRAVLLDRAEVLRIEMEGARATAVTLRQQDGATRRIAADRVILAAGALSSPRLLAASAGPDWPAGIGNRHDLVGRHLMFHLNEMIAVWTGTPAEEGPSKAVGFRDLCHAGGERLGMVQAMGLNARYGEILHVLRNRAAALPLGRSRLVQEGLRLPALLAERWLGSAAILVGLLEDLPDPENRVIHDPARPGRIVLAYRVTDELRRRRRLFRRLIARAFRGRRHLFLSDRPEPNLGHPCGTTRMGRTPAEGVTDALGRVHGTANLWIADAGLFPTSMGVNPSLTIAALALRQADSILKGRG